MTDLSGMAMVGLSMVTTMVDLSMVTTMTDLSMVTTMEGLSMEMADSITATVG